MNYKRHHLSELFDSMSVADFEGLKESIGINGVLNPITIYDGEVLDGWHRYTAANELCVQCPEQQLDDWIDPRDFVIAQNSKRKHQTSAQIASIVTAVYQWTPLGRPQKGAGPAPLVKTVKEMAKAAGVSERTIQQAKIVQEIASPLVKEAVKQGKVGLEKAAAIAKMPIEDQAEALDKPLPKPVAATIDEVPDYTELDAAQDQISDLRSELALAKMGDVPEEEKNQAAELIAELQSEIKSLGAQLKAVTSSRDYLMEENTQMRRQLAAQRRELDKLKK